MVDKVRVATWNMGGGEVNGGPSDKDTARILNEVRKSKVEIFLGQESQETDNLNVLRDLGYKIYRTHPESIVAWLPEKWTVVAKHDVILNPKTPFYRKGKKKPIYIRMANVLLCNDEGVSLNVASYHTPAGVNVTDPPARRLKALKESMRTLSKLGKETKCNATLFGGDDNVDEVKDPGSWAFMGVRATGLRQIKAPRPTLGRRKVDDFRVRKLKPVGKGRTIKGPTHHDVHIQTFQLPS